MSNITTDTHKTQTSQCVRLYFWDRARIIPKGSSEPDVSHLYARSHLPLSCSEEEAKYPDIRIKALLFYSAIHTVSGTFHNNNHYNIKVKLRAWHLPASWQHDGHCTQICSISAMSQQQGLSKALCPLRGFTATWPVCSAAHPGTCLFAPPDSLCQTCKPQSRQSTSNPTPVLPERDWGYFKREGQRVSISNVPVQVSYFRLEDERKTF